MDIKPQILIAAYPDGLLITIDGRSTFHHMSPRQMIELASELIEKASRGCLEKHAMAWYDRGRKKQKKSVDPNRTVTCDVCGKDILVMGGGWVVLANGKKVHHTATGYDAEEDCLYVLRNMRTTDKPQTGSPRILFVED